MEFRRIVLAFQCDGVFLRAGRAKIVGQATDAQHQRVVMQAAGGADFKAAIIQNRRQLNLLFRAIQARHLAEQVAKVVPVGLRQIFQFVFHQAAGSCGDLVQQRLPHVGRAFVDERNFSEFSLAQGVADFGGEFKATGAAADDDDAVRLIFAHAS